MESRPNVLSKSHLQFTMGALHAIEPGPLTKPKRKPSFIRKCWNSSKLMQDAKDQRKNDPTLKPCMQRIEICYGQGCYHALKCDAVPDKIKRKFSRPAGA